MSYKIDFSEDALSKLEALGTANAKIMKQVFMKCLALRRNPKPQDCEDLQNFIYKGFKGRRVDQGEYRIIFAVDEDHKKVFIGPIHNRNEDYKEIKKMR